MPPLVVCCGIGQDSSGALAGLVERGLIPDLIVAADVGGEHRATYAFRPVLDDWFEDH